MYGPATLLQIRHAETGIETTGESEDDVFAHDLQILKEKTEREKIRRMRP
jgi:hypothetical protein